MRVPPRIPPEVDEYRDEHWRRDATRQVETAADAERFIDAVGFAAHVPHYLAQATYPAASLSLLEHLERLTGLHLPTEGLREAAEANRTEIDEQIGRSSENIAVVAALEQQYDNFTAAREGTDLLSAAGEVPSAEEIGAEFERFLADQDRKRPRD